LTKIQELLPNIKDVSQRAGLVNEVAPQMEAAMDNLEKSIKSKRTSSILELVDARQPD